MRIKIDPLDKLFSQYVRMLIYTNGVASCEYCGRKFYDTIKENGDIYPAWKYLQVSHFISRRKRSTRYDKDNAAGVCFSCHMYLGENPYAHTEWFKKRLGSERFELLNIRASMIVKIDKVKLKSELKEKIELLGTEVAY